MFWIITIAIVVTLVWYWKVSKGSIKQLNLTSQYLTMLMLVCKSKEEFEKLLWRLYDYDSDTIPYDEFNQKWEAICEAAKVPVIKTSGSTQFVSSRVVGLIAENIFDDPINKRYIKHINDKYPESLSVEELKKHAFDSD